MNNTIASLICLFLFLGLGSCKDASHQSTTQQIAQSRPFDTESALRTTQDSEPVYRYVIAPNGLSLRATNSLDSKKLAGMPLGSRVTLLNESYETPLEIEYIKGGMQQVQYNEQIGYAFNGYLSPIPLAEKEQATEDYLADLKTRFPEVSYESRPNDPDFHEGTTDTYTIPATTWHEAYYLVAALYRSPKTLGFPNPAGPDLELFEDPEKPDDVWDSFLTATREKNALKKIGYDYRAAGFGYGYTIERESEKLFKVVYLGFVD